MFSSEFHNKATLPDTAQKHQICSED